MILLDSHFFHVSLDPEVCQMSFYQTPIEMFLSSSHRCLYLVSSVELFPVWQYFHPSCTDGLEKMIS
jgi:hypothetical protein